MIKHIVAWKIKDSVNNVPKDTLIQQIKDRLETLPGKIDVIRFYELGINIIHSDRAFDLVLVSEFESIDDLNTYRVHPEHQKAVEFISDKKSEAMVVDYKF